MESAPPPSSEPQKVKKRKGKAKSSRSSKVKSANDEKRRSSKATAAAANAGPTEMELLSADPTQRWEHQSKDVEEEKRRIEDYKAKRRQRYEDFWKAQIEDAMHPSELV
eukprot:m.191220 g.191220  ORF g.191220 m.191220 type:complete len:109 (-) comp18280_c0_seq1:102-428(-)